MSISRRGLFAGVAGLAALPLAKLLPESAQRTATVSVYSLRQWGKLFRYPPANYLRPSQWEDVFAEVRNLPVGATLRIKLPTDYRLTDRA